MQLPSSLEVVAYVVRHILGQHCTGDTGHLKAGGIPGRQAPSKAMRVEGERQLIGLLELVKNGAVEIHRSRV